MLLLRHCESYVSVKKNWDISVRVLKIVWNVLKERTLWNRWGSNTGMLWYICFLFKTTIRGESENLEQPNLEVPIFRNFKTASIEVTKQKLFEIFW